MVPMFRTPRSDRRLRLIKSALWYFGVARLGMWADDGISLSFLLVSCRPDHRPSVCDAMGCGRVRGHDLRPRRHRVSGLEHMDASAGVADLYVLRAALLLKKPWSRHSSRSTRRAVLVLHTPPNPSAMLLRCPKQEAKTTNRDRRRRRCSKRRCVEDNV